MLDLMVHGIANELAYAWRRASAAANIAVSTPWFAPKERTLPKDPRRQSPRPAHPIDPPAADPLGPEPMPRLPRATLPAGAEVPANTGLLVVVDAGAGRELVAMSDLAARAFAVVERALEDGDAETARWLLDYRLARARVFGVEHPGQDTGQSIEDGLVDPAEQSRRLNAFLEELRGRVRASRDVQAAPDVAPAPAPIAEASPA